MRHAIAEPRGRVPDARRKLTPRGKERFAAVVAGLRELGWSVDQVYHSPWRRAAETAALLAPLLERGGGLVALSGLARAPGPALLEAIRGKRPALVGHEPWLGQLVALLVTGQAGSGFELRKGGVALLEGEPRPGGMRLLALVPPRVLRKMR